MKLAKQHGVAPASPPVGPESEEMDEKIYNFGVYKYGKSKASRSILQVRRGLTTKQKENIKPTHSEWVRNVYPVPDRNADL